MIRQWISTRSKIPFSTFGRSNSTILYPSHQVNVPLFFQRQRKKFKRMHIYIKENEILKMNNLNKTCRDKFANLKYFAWPLWLRGWAFIYLCTKRSSICFSAWAHASVSGLIPSVGVQKTANQWFSHWYFYLSKHLLSPLLQINKNKFITIQEEGLIKFKQVIKNNI